MDRIKNRSNLNQTLKTLDYKFLLLIFLKEKIQIIKKINANNALLSTSNIDISIF